MTYPPLTTKEDSLTTKQLRAFVLRLAPLMGLSDWEFLWGDPLSSPPGESDAYLPTNLGQVFIPYAQRRAEFRFSPELLLPSTALSLVRRVVAHELVHCLLEPITVAARSASNHLGAESRLIAEDSLRDAVESACDAIASAWAEVLPLP